MTHELDVGKSFRLLSYRFSILRKFAIKRYYTFVIISFIHAQQRREVNL